MMKKCLLFCALFLSGFLFAKAQVELPENINTTQDTYVFQDPRIDLLIQQQRYLNTIALRNVSGYRVQVISTRSRDEANTARAKLMNLFPQYKTYLNYQSPYFRVRIGNFIQKDSATVLQKELIPYFPQGVFSVKTEVKIDPNTLLEQLKAKHDPAH